MEQLLLVSNPKKVQNNLNDYLGGKARLYISTRKDKKYMIYNDKGKAVHFGSLSYEDFTKHNDKERQKRYLARATKIKGDWKNDKYSPNNLSIHLLWS